MSPLKGNFWNDQTTAVFSKRSDDETIEITKIDCEFHENCLGSNTDEDVYELSEKNQSNIFVLKH